MSEFDYGTGRRKNATARTRLYAGNGAIEVNGRKVEDYFPRSCSLPVFEALSREARFRFVQAGGNPGLLAFISACVRWLLWEGLRFIIR